MMPPEMSGQASEKDRPLTREVAVASDALRRALTLASEGLVERESLLETIVLAAVAGEHVLVIGPPGTAKSEAVRRVAGVTGGRYFEYLLGRFTEPSEIFGPIDLRRLREGVVETETAGMMPEAEFAFLDEVFRGSTAILNTLLGILNERTFRRGRSAIRCPLRVCVGASNGLPEDDSLAAFADRFLVRVFVEPIPDPQIEELLAGGWSLGTSRAEPRAGVGDIDALALAAQGADMEPVRPHLAHAIRVLRGAGVALSDRRAVKTQRLIAAAAVLGGRARPSEADLWPLVLAVPTREQQATARECLAEVLGRTQNPLLAAAAEEASLGSLARATRLATAGREVLSARPPAGDAAALEDWRLRLEGIVREIDAGFVREALPEDLAAVRTTIADLLRSAPSGDGRPSP
jgi:MoxR-like ATPase